MKALKILAGLAVLVAMALPAQAQQWTASSNYYVLAATATTNMGTVFGLQKYEDVSIQINGKLAAAGTGSTTFNWHRSVDGTTWENTPALVMHLVNAGTVNTVAISNLNAGACGYLLLSNAVPAGAVAGTNWVFIARKPQRFGR
jgi:hypothetical protein